MRTNCAIFSRRLYTGSSKKNKKKLARFFNFTFRYILYNVLSLNNSKVGDYVDRIYLRAGLERNFTTKEMFQFSHCELSIYISICNNIPAAPVYGVYISQSIRYSSVCGSYGFLLTEKLLS